MGLIKDLLGSAKRSDCDDYAKLLNEPTDDDLTPQQYEAARKAAAGKLPATVRRMVENGKY